MPLSSPSESEELPFWFSPDGLQIYRRHGLHNRFTQGPNYNLSAVGHLCVDGLIRPYESCMCSKCWVVKGLDVIMSDRDIEKHNQERGNTCAV